MKSNILSSIILCIAYSVVVKSSPSLNRQKRVDNTAASSQRLRSPFQPPDENGNTVNYEENHLLPGPNENYGYPARSPFLPPAEPELQVAPKISAIRNRIAHHPPPTTTTKKPKAPKRRVQNVRNKSQPKPRQQSPQNAYPSPQNNGNQQARRTGGDSHDANPRSPFQPRDTEEFRQGNDVERSSRFRKESDTQRRPVYHQAVKGNNVRKPSAELEIIMERQRENTREIPSISDIKVSPRQRQRKQQQPSQQQNAPKSSHPIKRKANRSRPRHTSYQNKVQTQRDMHDVGPGVTPWTRYTARPRNAEQKRENNPSTFRGRCGNKQYSPRNQICCEGKILRRQGVQPSCCRAKTYDAVYKKCCRGEVVMLTVQKPGC